MMERGMNHRRYRKTEETILRVFFDENQKGISMQKMAKKAGLGRSTMYTHHHAIREIIPDYERYMLVEFQTIERRKMRVKNTQLRSLYLDLLLFILRNRKVFEMFLRYGDRNIYVMMIKKLETKIINFARLPSNSEKLFAIYTNEVVGVIEGWGKSGFSENEVEKVLGDIMYLTETCRDRLMPICR